MGGIFFRKNIESPTYSCLFFSEQQVVSDALQVSRCLFFKALFTIPKKTQIPVAQSPKQFS